MYIDFFLIFPDLLFQIRVFIQTFIFYFGMSVFTYALNGTNVFPVFKHIALINVCMGLEYIFILCYINRLLFIWLTNEGTDERAKSLHRDSCAVWKVLCAPWSKRRQNGNISKIIPAWKNGLSFIPLPPLKKYFDLLVDQTQHSMCFLIRANPDTWALYIHKEVTM